jgi:hypothetical protein
MTGLSEELLRRIVPIDRILKLCWFGLLGSLGIYIFLAYQINQTANPHPPQHLPSVVTYVLSLGGIMSTILSLWLRKLLLSPRAFAKYLDDKGPVWIYNCINSSPLSNSARLDEMEKKILTFASKVQILQLILWGMLNTTAIFGLVLSIFISQPHIIFAFTVPVFFIALVQFPGIRNLLESGLLAKSMIRD